MSDLDFLFEIAEEANETNNEIKEVSVERYGDGFIRIRCDGYALGSASYYPNPKEREALEAHWPRNYCTGEPDERAFFRTEDYYN